MRWILLTSLLVACGPHTSERPPRVYTDATELMAAARARALPAALAGSYGIHIESPLLGIQGTTRGGLLVQEPNRFRLDVMSPFGTPLVYAVSDGVGFNIFVVNKNTLYATPDAEALLRDASGGAAGLADIVAVLVGRAPFAEREVIDVQDGEGEFVYTFAGPEGTRAELALDDADATTRRIAAYDAAGALALRAVYSEPLKIEGASLPGEVDVEVPALQLTVELSFKSWSPTEPGPEVFQAPAAAGAAAVDLGELLRKARAGELSPPGE